MTPARHCLAALGRAGDPDTLPHIPPALPASTSHRDLCQPPALHDPFPAQASARAQTTMRTTARTPPRPRRPRPLSTSRTRTTWSAPRARRTASPRRGRLHCTPSSSSVRTRCSARAARGRVATRLRRRVARSPRRFRRRSFQKKWVPLTTGPMESWFNWVALSLQTLPLGSDFGMRRPLLGWGLWCTGAHGGGAWMGADFSAHR